MKLLIIGSRGQLGSELLKLLKAGRSAIGPVSPAIAHADVAAADLDQVDISDLTNTKHYISHLQPDIVINCAAYTNVDKCETDMESALKGNVLGARNIAIAAEHVGAKLVHISTDYVFPGDVNAPLREWDICSPKSVYGKSKYLGEQYIQSFCTRFFIVRTAWLYGLNGGNFVKTILRAARQNGTLKVVSDQFGNPTNAEDLAHHLLCLAVTDSYGIYHCTNNGVCSWFDFASEIIRLSGMDCAVSPCATDEFPRPAKRPAYSSLDNAMLRTTIGDKMRSWQDAIADYMKHYNRESGEIEA